MTRRSSCRTFLPSPGRAAQGMRTGNLHDRQQDFAAALLDPTLPMPPGLVGPDRKPDVKRFNIYRNNVVTALIDALSAAFPAVRRIAGDAFFTAMARIYVVLDPPRSPVMLEYGETFPRFIEAFEPASSVPYLADVARLERAWAEAYHAAESVPIALAELGAVAAPRVAQISLKTHPSLRVVRSPFPVVDLWHMNLDGGTPVAIDLCGGGQHALVIRPHADVEVRQVTNGAATFVQCLVAGRSLAVSTSLARHADAGFDLARALVELFAIGAIVGWSPGDDADAPPGAQRDVPPTTRRA
ncbi:HvfC/BufC N-terminal domain-containing protein [Paraburkholderia oxyphila]|uniref:HvfC/BufC N-terminal domain-containing protein n=1 Tax=Paraburkholderia oxyphila TaxID=614212 RepID=UPI000484C77F|nr:DNA-binding domain-containing protein [Paraburkholderia oxyphila]